MASGEEISRARVENVHRAPMDGDSNAKTCKVCGRTYKESAAKHEKRCRVRCKFCKKRHHGRNIEAHVARCKYNKTRCGHCGKMIRVRSCERHSSTCKKRAQQPGASDDSTGIGQPWKDIFEPRIEHAWFQFPDVDDVQACIRKGWPKSLDEYPFGHEPANPPGCCSMSCTCMEDWHLGSGCGAIKREWASETTRRVLQAEEAVALFAGCKNFVRQRGAVSRKHYLEANVDEPMDLRKRLAGSARLHFARASWELMREAAKEIPPRAFLSPTSGRGSLMRALATAYHAPGNAPNSFHVEQAPPWFNLDCVSGCILASTAQPSSEPSNDAGSVAIVVLNLLDAFGNIIEKMELGLKLGDGEVDCSSLRRYTDHLATVFSELWPSDRKLGTEGKMVDILANQMQRIFDLLGTQRLRHSGAVFSAWVFGMSYLAAIAFGSTFCMGKLPAKSKNVKLGPSPPKSKTISMQQRFQSTLNAAWLAQQGIDLGSSGVQVPDVDLMEVYDQL